MDRQGISAEPCGNRTSTRPRKRPGFALLSALDRISGFPCPRQQFIETVLGWPATMRSRTSAR